MITFEQIKKIILGSTRLKPEMIQQSSIMSDDLNLSSLDIAEVIFEIEQLTEKTIEFNKVEALAKKRNKTFKNLTLAEIAEIINEL